MTKSFPVTSLKDHHTWTAVYCVYTVTADDTSLNKDSDCYCCVTDGCYFTLFFKLHINYSDTKPLIKNNHILR